MVMVMVTMVRLSENVSGVGGSFFSFGRIICGVGLFLDFGCCWWVWVLFFCGLVRVILRSNLYYVCVLVLLVLVLVPVVAFLTSPKQSPDSSTS